MKISLIYSCLVAFHLFGAGPTYAKSPMKVETDHSGDPSNISTDEIVLSYDDGSKENLTKNGCMERVPVLSYDDSYIVFLRRFDSNIDGVTDFDDNAELWLMKLSSRAESRIAPQLAEPSQATWHPKKLNFAFIAEEQGKGRGLYIYDLATKSAIRVSDRADSWPAWSKSGEFIAFYDQGNRVVIYDVAKKIHKGLTKDVGNGWALYWTTDDRLVFTVEGTGWHIFSPGAKSPKLLDAMLHKRLTFVNQEEFGWSTK